MARARKMSESSLTRYFARRPWAARLVVIVLLFGLWEFAARFLVDPLFLSPPSQVVGSIVVGLWEIVMRFFADLLSLSPPSQNLPNTVFTTPGVPAALRLTLFELAVAFAIAVAAGLGLGLAIGLRPFARKSFLPIVLLLYGMPQVTILPLFILLFGIGAASKIAFGVTHGVFPVVVTVVAGVQNLKPILLTSARSMGASRWQIFRHVVFPHMVPSFFAGMRLGMSGVLLGVLLAELYVSIAGIGYFTTLFTQNRDPTKLFGLVGVLAAMAILLNGIVRRAESHFARWRS
jgi:ABC-type nitrate/sulfonate/bicarbonate transport system permease component